MRKAFFFLPLILLLSACTSSMGGLSGIFGNPVPTDITMTGTSDTLRLRVGDQVAWELSSLSDWLTVTPGKGLGPKDVKLDATFTSAIEDIPVYTAALRLTGDVNSNITVTLPLTQVRGKVVDTAQTQLRALQASPDINAGSMGLRPAPLGSSGEILVKYRSGVSSNQFKNGVQASGAKINSVDSLNRLSKLTTSDPASLLKLLRADPNVEWAELNGRVSALGEPTDEFYPKQWHLNATGARFEYLQDFPAAVTVAVIDTGVRYDHPDLQGRLWKPGEGAYDFVGDSPNPNDACADLPANNPSDNDPTDPCDSLAMSGGSHGTHVTGLIVANSGTFAAPCATCSSSGVVGVAYAANVKVLPLRVLDARGNGSFEDVALAVRYAAGLPIQKNGTTLQNPHPAQVINLSLGSLQSSSAMCDAIKDASAAGSLVVAAAGNFQDSNPGALVYPAACDDAISVAATDRNYQVTYYSQQNDKVDIAVPGGNTTTGAKGEDGILSTTWNYLTNLPNYTYYMGTSQASPQVAAAIALVISSGKATTAAGAYTILKSKLTDLGASGRDNVYGDGFLNLPAAMGWVLPRGPIGLRFDGPSPRQISPTNGAFSTYLIPGNYRVKICADNSQNGLCDSGEPSNQIRLTVPSGPPLDVGSLSVGP